jgi:hypothetical protein
MKLDDKRLNEELRRREHDDLLQIRLGLLRTATTLLRGTLPEDAVKEAIHIWEEVLKQTKDYWEGPGSDERSKEAGA